MIAPDGGGAGAKCPNQQCHDRNVSCHLALESYERLLVVVGRSPVVLVGPGVRLVLISAGSGFAAARSGRWLAAQPDLILPSRMAIVVLAGWLALRWVGRPFRAWSGQLCVLTTHRIVISYSRKGPASWSIPYGMITDVVCIRSGRLRLRVNSLRIQTTLSPFPARLPNIGHLKPFMAAIAAVRADSAPDTLAGAAARRSHSAAGYR